MNTDYVDVLRPAISTTSPIDEVVGVEQSIDLLLIQLIELNIKIAVKDGNLHLNAPPGVLSDSLKRQLKNNKSALLNKLSRVERDVINMDWPRLSANKEQQYKPFPLSDVQHAYWMGRNKGIEFGNVATHYYYEIHCQSLDLQRFNSALNVLIRRHDMMRAIVNQDGEQEILETVPAYDVSVNDLSREAKEEQEAQILALRNIMSVQVHSTDRWPLYDIRAIQLNNQEIRLFFSWDFLNLDAWSLYTICREWATLYHNLNENLPPIRVSYRDYVLAEQSLRDSSLYQRDREYWWSRLDSLPEAPQLPIKTDIDPNHRHKFTRRSYRLNQADWQRLKRKGADVGITPSNILLTAYAEVLALWSQKKHFTLNLTFFNRLPLHEDIYKLVGDFTSLILLEVDTCRSESFQQRALQIQQNFMRDFEHRMISGVEVIREWSKRRGLSMQAAMPVVFTSCLVLNSEDGDDASLIEAFGQQVYGISQTPQVWLDNQIMEDKGDLTLNWDAVEEVFAPGILDAMFTAYCEIIDRLANDPKVWVEGDPVSLPSAQQTVRCQINQTQADINSSCLHEGFIQAAMQFPNNVAIQTPTRAISYAELLSLSCELAKNLESKGVGGESAYTKFYDHQIDKNHPELVAVVMEKGWQQVVAVMGVLIAGGAYIPIDPDLPKARIDLLFEQSQCSYAVTTHSVSLPTHVSVVELDQQALKNKLVQPPKVKQQRKDLAYVIFTSGSTGIPKGVMIDHAGAVNTLHHVNQLCKVSEGDKVLAVSSLSFDLSVYDIFGILAVGGTLVIPDAQLNNAPEHWLELINTYQVTLWNSAPPLMSMLLNSMEGFQQAPNISLRATLLSGDWLPLETKEKLGRYFPLSSLMSLGGATEASVWSIYYPVEHVDPHWMSIPYGKPLPNQTIHVLNQRLQSCPDGVIGDIYIGGIGLAQGYLGDKEKTDKHFIIHPESGERLYYTGDLGRYYSDGNIEFLGRSDSQVKVRGHRIELGELTSILKLHPAVKDAVVVVSGDSRTEQAITAYLQADQKNEQKLKVRLSATGNPELYSPYRISEFLSFSEKSKTLLPISTAYIALWEKLDALYFDALISNLCALEIFNHEKSIALDDLIKQLKIAERYRRWLYRALCFLQERGILIEDEGRYRLLQKLPAVDLSKRTKQCEEALISLLDFTLHEARWFTLGATKLIDILRENIHSAELYTADETAKIYQKLFPDSHNQLQEVIANAIALKQQVKGSQSSTKKINVLEVGAGLGSATQHLLPVLGGHCNSYVFTDISNYFLQRAREKFSGYDFLDYALLNLDDSPEQQGFSTASFDFIVASSMLHDVSDIKHTLNNLKKLLVPGGLLVLLEETKFWPSFDLTMGLQQGFDSFTDEDLRQNHPLMDRDCWCEVLKTVGFDGVQSMNIPNTLADYVGFEVIVAQMPNTVSVINERGLDRWVLNYLPSYMKPNQYQLLETFPLTNNGKIDYQKLVKVTNNYSGVTKKYQPVTSTQESLYRIWEKVLGHNDFGIHQPFFEVGGDSLLLVAMRNEIKNVLGLEVATTSLFEYPSIAALSEHLGSNTKSPDLSSIEQRVNKQKQAIKNRRKAMKKGLNA